MPALTWNTPVQMQKTLTGAFDIGGRLLSPKKNCVICPRFFIFRIGQPKRVHFLQRKKLTVPAFLILFFPVLIHKFFFFRSNFCPLAFLYKFYYMHNYTCNKYQIVITIHGKAGFPASIMTSFVVLRKRRDRGRIF